MFERFTRAARFVVTSAVAEAQRRGDRRVGTEHLLLGVLHERESAAARALGVDLGSAREALDSLDAEALKAVGIDAGAASAAAAVPPARGRLPFTSAAKGALQQALAEAVRDRSRRIGPTHLLLGLLGDGGTAASGTPNPAADVLTHLGVDAATVLLRLRDAA